jgi:hypothetical protein
MGIRVIDTDVWSYLYKGRLEAKLYEPHLFGNILVISFQTQAELLRGAIAAKLGSNPSTASRVAIAEICGRNLVVSAFTYLGCSNG